LFNEENLTGADKARYGGIGDIQSYIQDLNQKLNLKSTAIPRAGSVSRFNAGSTYKPGNYTQTFGIAQSAQRLPIKVGNVTRQVPSVRISQVHATPTKKISTYQANEQYSAQKQPRSSSVAAYLARTSNIGANRVTADFNAPRATGSAYKSKFDPLVKSSLQNQNLYFSSLNNTGNNFFNANNSSALRGKPLVNRPANYSASTPFRNNYVGHSASKVKNSYSQIDDALRKYSRV
jgi:hypothetical protein